MPVIYKDGYEYGGGTSSNGGGSVKIVTRADKTNEKKVVTKDFLQKYHQKSFQTISKEDFNKLSQEKKDCGITYYIYDKDATYPENKVISDKWDSEAIYEVGSYCIYKEQLWKCITRNSGVTPVAGSSWKAVNVGGELKTINESLNGLQFGVTEDGILTVTYDDGQ